MLLANVCAGFFRSCYEVYGAWLFWWYPGAPGNSVYMGDPSVALFIPHVYRVLGSVRMLSAGHALMAEVGGSFVDVTLLGVHWVPQNCASRVYFGDRLDQWMLYILALVGLPSLSGDYACMVLWVNGALWRNCRQKLCETSFSPDGFFCLVGTLYKDVWETCYGPCG